MKRRKDSALQAVEFKDAILEKVGPVLDQAQELIDQASHEITPMAKDAKKQTAKLAANALDKAQPAIDDAVERLHSDVLPRLSAALKEAAEDEIIATKHELKQVQKSAKKMAKAARKSGDKQIQALSAQLQPTREKKAGKVVLVIASLTAVLGGAAVLLKKYLGTTDESGWAAHEPSKAYLPDEEKQPDAMPTDAVADPAAEMVDEGAPVQPEEVVVDVENSTDGSVEDAKRALNEGDQQH